MNLRVGARRVGAERYLLVTIVAFAVTVAGTRWFLDLTGYPQVGGGGLHIAHMLWGGLLLVLAALLPLLFSGRRILMLSSAVAGVGVGLFIDEVGKFITSNNDYFFAPAAPLIYGAVLLLVAVWLVVRRRRLASPEDAMAAGLDAIRDGLDGRLSEVDRTRAVAALLAARPEDPDLAVIADAQIELLTSAAVENRLRPPGWLAAGGPRRVVARLLPRRLEQALIVGGLLLSTLQALFAALVLLALTWVTDPIAIEVTPGPVEFPQDPVWIILVFVIALGVGAIGGLAVVLMLMGRARASIRLAVAATLFNIVAGGLLTFYVAQFGAVGTMVGQVILLGLLLDYGERHVAASGGPSETSGAAPAT